MARKIKYHSLHLLFRLFAYLADKSGGWWVFVKPKLLLGSLIVGMTFHAGSMFSKESNDEIYQNEFQLISNSEIDSETRYDSDSTIYEKVDSMPKFPDGDRALLEYISKNLKHGPIAQCYNGIAGKVIVRFVITKQGTIGQIKVIRSLDPGCDKEAIRVVKSLPKWKPARLNGKNVTVWYTLPVSFKLE
jgi:protein TonB